LIRAPVPEIKENVDSPGSRSIPKFPAAGPEQEGGSIWLTPI
jgi:hypothetical protein